MVLWRVTFFYILALPAMYGSDFMFESIGWEGSTLFADLWEELCELFLAFYDGSGRKVIREAVFWNIFSLCRCLPDLFDSFSATERAELLSILFLL